MVLWGEISFRRIFFNEDHNDAISVHIVLCMVEIPMARVAIAPTLNSGPSGFLPGPSGGEGSEMKPAAAASFSLGFVKPHILILPASTSTLASSTFKHMATASASASCYFLPLYRVLGFGIIHFQKEISTLPSQNFDYPLMHFLIVPAWASASCHCYGFYFGFGTEIRDPELSDVLSTSL